MRTGELPDVVYKTTGVELGITNPFDKAQGKQESGDGEGRGEVRKVREVEKDGTLLRPAMAGLRKGRKVEESVRQAQDEPPLFSLRVTNPVTYLKQWWKRVMANEGIDLHLKIRPLTAIAMVTLLSGGSFALGRITLPASSPIVRYVPQLGPLPTPNPWKETAYRGILRYTTATRRYFLEMGEGEAVTLAVPANVNMAKLVGKRIFASGKYNTQTEVLLVAEAEDLEVLVVVAPVPTMATPSGGLR